MANHVLYDRLWESRKLAACSVKAALAYPWIYLVADHWGRFELLPRAIWGKVFGARGGDIKAREVAAWLAEYERVGLLVAYEVDGRRIARWTRFVGPPPARRRPSLLPDETGETDTEGLKSLSRFHSASLERGGRKVEGRGERVEGGRGEGDPPGESPGGDDFDLPAELTGQDPHPPDSQPSTRPRRRDREAGPPEERQRRDQAVEAILAAAVKAQGAGWSPTKFVEAASLIPASNGHGAKQFTDPRAKGLSIEWLEATARSAGEQLARILRGPPL